jgi:hypothetical protein
MQVKDQIPQEISAYMSQMGKKGGGVNKEKGSEYFKWVRSHGKNSKKPTSDQTESSQSDGDQ